MNKEQLKKVLKPMIKECIKEVIFEDGVLSSIISEVVKGTSTNVVVEAKQPPQSMRGNDEIKKKIAESRKQLADAIGNDSYNGVNLFEGTKPAPAPAANPHSPMAGTEPGDKGVDITAIPGAGNWNKLI